MRNLKKRDTITFINRLQEILLWALIFTLPFSKSMVEILFSCMLVLWVTKRILCYKRGERASLIRAFKPADTKLNFPILIFVSISFLSTLTSVSVFLSLEGFFFKLFEYVAIYFITVEIVGDTKKMDKVLTVILLSVALITINGLFQYFTGTGFIRGFSFSRYGGIRSSFGNANDFAAWLVMIVPFVLSLAYFWKDKWKVHFGKYGMRLKSIKTVLWVLTVFLLVCLILTGSRGAWVSAILSLVFLGIITKNKKLLITMPLIILFLPLVLPDSVKERAVSFLDSTSVGGSINIRLKLWQEAMEIIEDFPLLGTGPNTYSLVAPQYKNQIATGFYPHNSYLHMAAESGLLGLGAFLWMVLTLFASALKKVKTINDDFQRALFTGLLAGFFGFMGHSFVDTNLYSLQLIMLMWIVMGLIMAVDRNN